jgi:hypothetical protein
MSNTISLTIPERYEIVKYAHQIPSSNSTYFQFPYFLDVINITDEEIKEYGIKMDQGSIECNCPDKVFEYNVEDFPEIIMTTIRHFIDDLQEQIDEEKKNTPDHSASPLYVKIVAALSKLFPCPQSPVN